VEEVGAGALAKHWRRGAFPLAFLARAEGDSVAWRRQFIQTFLERDVPQFGIAIPAAALLRFWTMLAHYHMGTSGRRPSRPGRWV
jgi:predicted AAA+ superfamily ATPase